MDDVMKIVTGLVELVHDLLTGAATPDDARRRVRDILPERSASAQAAEDIARGR